MTKKDLLEAIEDMPMDAEVVKPYYSPSTGMIDYHSVSDALYEKEHNQIIIA